VHMHGLFWYSKDSDSGIMTVVVLSVLSKKFF
jgi:hypothetical protein